MNFAAYFVNACSLSSSDSLVPVSLGASSSFFKDNLVTGLLLPQFTPTSTNFAHILFVAEDFINLLFKQNTETILLNVLSAPFQISFRGGFFSSGVGTEPLSNLIFFLNVF